jgi:phosphatidylinositol 4-kinase type 2
MYAKQIAVMKGQAWNVVETLKTPDLGPLELTRRARVCVWDDIVEIPIAVPLRATLSEERRREQPLGRQPRVEEEHEEMDITAVSTPPPQKAQKELLLHSPPLETAHENRFNLTRDSSSLDIRRGPDSPSTVSDVYWSSRNFTNGRPANGRPANRPRASYDAPRRNIRESNRHHRRFSLNQRRDDMYGDEDEGDLGYAANEDAEGNRKKVIVERLEMVKGRNPVFTWC